MVNLGHEIIYKKRITFATRLILQISCLIISLLVLSFLLNKDISIFSKVILVIIISIITYFSILYPKRTFYAMLLFLPLNLAVFRIIPQLQYVPFYLTDMIILLLILGYMIRSLRDDIIEIRINIPILIFSAFTLLVIIYTLIQAEQLLAYLSMVLSNPNTMLVNFKDWGTVGVFPPIKRMFRIILFYLLFIFVINTFKKIDMKNLARFIILSLVIAATIGLIQSFFVDCYELDGGVNNLSIHICKIKDPTRVTGFFIHPLSMAGFLIIGIPLLVSLLYHHKSLRERSMIFIFLLITLLCLYYTNSRGSIMSLALAFFIGMVYLIFRIKNKKNKYLFSAIALIIIVIGVSAMIFNPRTDSESLSFNPVSIVKSTMPHRINAWSTSLNMVYNEPFGVGLNQYSINYEKYHVDTGPHNRAPKDHPHNMYLNIATELGVLGAVLFIGLMIIIIFIGYRHIQNKPKDIISIGLLVSLLAFAINSLTEVLFYSIPEGGILFWTMSGMLIILSGDKD